MAAQIPVKAIYSGSDVTSLGEYASGDTIADTYLAGLTASKLTGALPAISGAALTNLPADATKLPLAGGTMTGDIVLGTNKIGGLEINHYSQTYSYDSWGLGTDAVSSITGGGFGAGNGYGNIGIGRNALKVLTTGSQNIAIGTGALDACIDGDVNIAMGEGTLGKTTSGSGNVGIGVSALKDNTTANYNTGVGWNAIRSNTTGTDNTAIGNKTLYGSTTGSYNTALGWQSLYANTTGSKNIAVGYGAGDAITTGSNNTIIGDYAGTTTLADTVAIYAGTTERLKVTSSGLTINGSAIVSYDSTVAAAALPKSGGTMTGTITTLSITETETTKTASFTPNLTTDGTIFDVSGAITITMPSATAGKSFTIIDAGTGTLSWSGTIKWAGGSAPSPSGITIYSFISNGTNWYGMMAGTGFA